MKNILFLCTGNSCRSQMAEGLARKYLSKNIKVYSAGIAPTEVHPIAIKVMNEIGIDISSQNSKDLSQIPINEIDTVITLCGDAAENCPNFPGNVKRIHWNLTDPAKAEGAYTERLAKFRQIRDQIKEKLIEFPK